MRKHHTLEISFNVCYVISTQFCLSLNNFLVKCITLHFKPVAYKNQLCFIHNIQEHQMHTRHLTHCVYQCTGKVAKGSQDCW